MIDSARMWQRPAMTALFGAGYAVLVFRLPPDAVLPALVWTVGALVLIYLVRGVVDKGWLERVLAIWKGRDVPFDANT
jgi:hypothetical protein